MDRDHGSKELRLNETDDARGILISVYIYICIHIYTYIYIHIYIYIYICIRTYKPGEALCPKVSAWNETNVPREQKRWTAGVHKHKQVKK